MADLSRAALSRILSILDEGSFVEIGACVTGKNRAGFADSCMDNDKVMDGDGVVTGYGTVEGRMVYVYSQNPAVYGGSIGEMHAKKISRIYNMAIAMGAPVLALVDCSGVRVDEGNDSLYSFGRLFAHQAKANGVVPVITAVYGNCGGGMAVCAAMSDFVLMEKSSRLFVNSPDAVSGNYEEKCDTASAVFQSEQTGLCDFSGTAEEIAVAARKLLSILPENNETDYSYSDVCTDDLNRSVSGIDSLKSKFEMLQQISDNGEVLELKKEYAKDVFAGFIRLNGRTVGAVANACPQLSSSGAEKAAGLINFCDSFCIPVLTLCDTDGFDRKLCNEKRIAGSLARLTYAYANATVPMVTLVSGTSYGTAGLVMGSKSLGTDLVFAYPDAKIGLMDSKLMDRLTDLNKDRDVYSSLYSAQKGYVDDIILPEESRQRLAAAFEMLFTKSISIPAKKHGTL